MLAACTPDHGKKVEGIINKLLSRRGIRRLLSSTFAATQDPNSGGSGSSGLCETGPGRSPGKFEYPRRHDESQQSLSDFILRSDPDRARDYVDFQRMVPHARGDGSFLAVIADD